MSCKRAWLTDGRCARTTSRFIAAADQQVQVQAAAQVTARTVPVWMTRGGRRGSRAVVSAELWEVLAAG